MTNSKIPAHTNPRYVCARIRKLLAAKGWPLQKTTGRYSAFGSTQQGTEGYEVHKIGCSKVVAVSYRGSYRPSFPSALPKETIRKRVHEAIDYLQGLGYRVDSRGWNECDNYDDCDW